MSEPEAPEDAAAEIAALSATFGADVWRMRRLAELGVAQAKINHDLRNLMTPALMLADRLQGSAAEFHGREGPAPRAQPLSARYPDCGAR
jgi:hypothetical protein